MRIVVKSLLAWRVNGLDQKSDNYIVVDGELYRRLREE